MEDPMNKPKLQNLPKSDSAPDSYSSTSEALIRGGDDREIDQAADEAANRAYRKFKEVLNQPEKKKKG
jgi:hypothetical protein